MSRSPEFMERYRAGKVKIVGVAIRLVDGTMFTLDAPNRHGHLLPVVAKARPGWRMRYGVDEQGFVTDCGEFLSRKQAAVVALKSGQWDGVYAGGNVFTSEDLW